MATHLPESRTVRPLLHGSGIAVLILGVAGLVYVMGGTRTVYPHFGYLPVMAAAYFFGRSGGIIAGVVMGLAVGPWMPLEVAEQSTQEPVNWLWRTVFFVIVGFGVGHIVQQLRASAENIYRASRRDAHTALLNRAAFLDTLTARRNGRRSGPLTCILVDLLGYERVLCALGSNEADNLVCSTANRMQEAFPDTQLYQLTPTRFAVILDQGTEQALRCVDRVQELLSAPLTARGITIPMTLRFGIANSKSSDTDPWRLSQQAATALELAHQERRDHILHYPELDILQQDALQLIGAFREALDSGAGLSVSYQPIVDLQTGQCHSVEALVRWQDKRFGAVSPSRLVPLVEAAGMAPALTRWMLGRVVGEWPNWSPYSRAGVAINISALDLEDPELPEYMESLMAETGFPVERLDVELTESEVMVHVGRAMETLDRLNDMGVRISIDDFGTGRSSLAYLSQLPASTLKIDRSFIDGLASDANKQTITRIAIELARDLGFRSVAEGVEDEGIHNCLREWGCDRAQGYFYARPLSLDDLIPWLQARA